MAGFTQTLFLVGGTICPVSGSRTKARWCCCSGIMGDLARPLPPATGRVGGEGEARGTADGA